MNARTLLKLAIIIFLSSYQLFAQDNTSFNQFTGLNKTNSGTWYSLTNGTNGFVSAIAVEDSNTSVYIGGTFTSAIDSNGNDVSYTSYIARWNGTEWKRLGRGTNNTVKAITISNGYVYVGGDFTSAINSDGSTVSNTAYIARWNGSEWEAIGNGTDNSVYIITADGTDIYAGGNFTNAIDSDGSSVAGTRKIAKWDGSNWSALGYGGDDYVYDIKVSGGNVYVGGQFTLMKNGQFETAFNTQGIAYWDGSEWHALGQGVQGTVYATEIIDGDVYTAGSFPNAYESDGTLTAVNYIGVWDGSSWSTLGNGAAWNVYDIVTSNNQIYFCGIFGSVKDEFNISVSNTQYIAKWTGSAWNTLTFADKPDNYIYCMALGNGRMYVGGAFTSVGGAANTNYVSYFTDASNPLPVELISFTAENINNAVQLHWQTATELNNYGFELERKNPQLPEGEEWVEIGFVPGHGNSNSSKSYEFTDTNPPQGNLVYRLKQIDTDGTWEYFQLTVEINSTVSSIVSPRPPAEFSLSQNYPNPFNPSTTIQYGIPAVETSHAASLHVKLIVFDILGQEISTLVNEQQKPGEYSIKFDASGLPSGIYFYKLCAGKFKVSRKLILLK